MAGQARNRNASFICLPREMHSLAAAEASFQRSGLRFGGVFASSEAGGGPQFGPHGFWIHAWRRRRLRRRRARFFWKRLAFHEQFYFGGVNHFAFEQSLRDALEDIFVARENVPCSIVRGADDALHFLVDLNGGIF